MNISFTSLQFPIDQLELAEWMIASIILVVVVTLIYLFVLNRAPPPEGITVVKAEQSALATQSTFDPNPPLTIAGTDLKANNFSGAIENSVEAVRLCLSAEMGRVFSRSSQGMGISEIAYLLQSKAKSGPVFANPVYQLSDLRLKAAQNQSVAPEEASWAVSFAGWLVNVFQNDQVKF